MIGREAAWPSPHGGTRPDAVAGLGSAAAAHPAPAPGRATMLARPDRGLWAVADPVGPHAADALAAIATIAALGRLADAATIDTDAIRALLGRADAAIRIARADAGAGRCAGAGIVVLHVAAAAATLLRAGDGRAYRWRAGTLRCLAGGEAAPWRAIGGVLPVEIEAVPIRLVPGDRLLICSPALAAALPVAMIARRLAAPPAEAGDALVEAALCAGGRGTLSAVVIAIA